MLKKQIKWVTLAASVVLFMAALTQECYCTNNGCGGRWSGLAIFISGVFAFMTCAAGFTWFANPLLLASSILLFIKPKIALYTSLAATAIAFSFLLFPTIIQDEAGNFSKITGYRAGYWLWCSSALVMFIGCLLHYKLNRVNSNKY